MVGRLRRWLAERRRRRHRRQLERTWDSTYGECPACALRLVTHPPCGLASSRPHDGASRHALLEAAIATGDRATAAGIQELLGTDDACVYELFQCRDTGRTVLVKEHSYGELWHDDEVVEKRVPSEAEAASLDTVPLRWRPLLEWLDGTAARVEQLAAGTSHR